MFISSPSEQNKVLQFARSTAVTAALVPVSENSLIWLPLNESGADEDNAYAHECTLSEAPKATGQVWAIGALLYYHISNAHFTTTSAGAVLCGRVGAPALSADAIGTVLFHTFTPAP